MPSPRSAPSSRRTRSTAGPAGPAARHAIRRSWPCLMCRWGEGTGEAINEMVRAEGLGEHSLSRCRFM